MSRAPVLLRPGVIAEFDDPRDVRPFRAWCQDVLTTFRLVRERTSRDRLARTIRTGRLDRLTRALDARAAAVEEVTAAWYAADCPPGRNDGAA